MCQKYCIGLWNIMNDIEKISDLKIRNSHIIKFTPVAGKIKCF